MNKVVLLVAVMSVACARGVDEGGSRTSASATGGASGGPSASMAASGGGPGSGGAGATGSGGTAGSGGAGASSSSTGGSTGCLLSSECTPTEYCNFPDDQCGGGAPGACTVRPPNCMDVYDPKCGCNGLEYANACYAAVQGEDVDAYGLCM